MAESMPPTTENSSATRHERSDDKQHKEKLPIKVLYMLGSPGAGKGTLCKLSDVKDSGWEHLSVGDYLRDLCDEKYNFPPAARAGLTVEDLSTNMRQTKLLPAEPMVEILRYKLEQQYRSQGHHKFIIDGFPRTVESAELFDERVAKPLLVVDAWCNVSVAKQRFLSRGREGSDNDAKFEARYAQFLEQKPAIDKRYEGQIRFVCTEDSRKSNKQMLDILNLFQSDP